MKEGGNITKKEEEEGRRREDDWSLESSSGSHRCWNTLH